MVIALSTEDVHPRERLSYWREVATKAEVELSAPAAFLATLRNQVLDNVGVSELACDPCEIGRSARNIARASCDHFLLYIQLSGRAIIKQDDRCTVGENGSIVLLDTRRPYTMNVQGSAKSIALKIPRQALEARLGAAAALAGRAVDAGRPLTGLTSAFVRMLPSRIEAVDRCIEPRLAEQALDLVALAFSVEADQTAVLSSVRATALIRLKAAIEARLCDAALNPAAAAAAAGISVRYANDLLAPEGYSLARYVLHRRLERCRRVLEDPTQSHRLIGEIAFSWGFSDLSHFVRRFRAAYAITPGDCRRGARTSWEPKQTQRGGSAGR
jgi:AraC-like DNA-binding protein